MQSGYQPHSSRIKSDHDEHARFDRVARIKREANTQLPQLPVQSLQTQKVAGQRRGKFRAGSRYAVSISSLQRCFSTQTLHERGANPSKSNSTDIVVLTFHGDLMIL